MNQPVVVVLSKYPDIFEGFRESVDRDAPDAHKVVLWDRDTAGELKREGYAWTSAWHSSPFHMAGSANNLWKMAIGKDLLYAGDDTRFIEPDTIKRLQEVAYSDPAIGIVSPRIKDQDAPHEGEVSIEPFAPFVMVYIKAEVIARVGYLDEDYPAAYAFEDIAYCVRVRQAGFKIAYANNVWIQHGVDGHRFGSTFRRTIGLDGIEKGMGENLVHFAKKQGIEPTAERVWQFVRDLC